MGVVTERSRVDPVAVIEDLCRIVNPEGIQLEEVIRLGAVDQWVSIRGRDRANPVLLVVHGGPATPLTPTMWMYQRGLEEYFTIVNYDQRGAGRSYRLTDPADVADTLTLDRYAADAIELAEHVKALLDVPSMAILGHSWGTAVAVTAVLARPDLFWAYIGCGQLTSGIANEQLSFEYGMRRAAQENNTAAMAEMTTISPYPGDDPVTLDRVVVARKWPQHYGGLTAYRSTTDFYFDGPALSPDYTDQDVAALDQGSVFTVPRVLDEMIGIDFRTISTFPVPMVQFLGRHDWTTPTAPTKAWLNEVDAPVKVEVWFERSAHMMMYEEPGKFLLSLVTHVLPHAPAQQPP